MNKIVRYLLQFGNPFSKASYLFWSIWTIGELVDAVFIRKAILVFLFGFFLPWILLGLSAFMIDRKTIQQNIRISYPKSKVISLLFVIILTSYLMIPAIIGHFYARHDNGAWTLAPNIDTTWCTPNCWSFQTDEFGWRNLYPPSDESKTPVVSVIGDSFIFGMGVEQDETVSRALQKLLLNDYPNIRVFNNGVLGMSLTSFPKLAKLVKRQMGPDLYVIRVHHNDLDITDIATRLEEINSGFYLRFLQAINMESLHEVITKIVIGETEDPNANLKRLDKIRKTIPKSKLLLVFDVAPKRINDWVLKNSNVSWYAAYDDEKWQNAERLKHDHHWSPNGNKTIAECLLEPISQMLAGNYPYRSKLRIKHKDKYDEAKITDKKEALFELVAKSLSSASTSAKMVDENKLKFSLTSEKHISILFYNCDENDKWYFKNRNICFALDATTGLNEAEEKKLKHFLSSLSSTITNNIK